MPLAPPLLESSARTFGGGYFRSVDRASNCIFTPSDSFRFQCFSDLLYEVTTDRLQFVGACAFRSYESASSQWMSEFCCCDVLLAKNRAGACSFIELSSVTIIQLVPFPITTPFRSAARKHRKCMGQVTMFSLSH